MTNLCSVIDFGQIFFSLKYYSIKSREISFLAASRKGLGIAIIKPIKNGANQTVNIAC